MGVDVVSAEEYRKLLDRIRNIEEHALMLGRRIQELEDRPVPRNYNERIN